MKLRTIYFSLVAISLTMAAPWIGLAQTSTATFATSSPSSEMQSLITRLQEQVLSLQKQIKDLQAQIDTSKKEIETVKKELKITRALSRGATGDDVKELQQFLASKFPDLYPEGLVTGYFGPATEAAVKKLQEKQGIESIGIVGPKTLLKLNELVTQGAGESEKVLSGLLTAPGLQGKTNPLSTETTTASTTPSRVILFISTTTPPVASSTPSSTSTPITTVTPATTTPVFVPAPSSSTAPTPSTNTGPTTSISTVPTPSPSPTATTTTATTTTSTPSPSSSPSPSPSSTPTSNPYPAVPTNVIATVLSSSSVQITWSASSNSGAAVARYQIARTTVIGPVGIIGTVNASPSSSTYSYTDTNLTPGTAYLYSVGAISTDNHQSNLQPTTPEIITTPSATAAPVISAVQAVNTTGTNEQITWTTDQLSDSAVRYGTTPATYTNSVLADCSGSISVTSHCVNLMNLAYNTIYYYTTTSFSANGSHSGSSSEKQFTSPSGDPGPPTLNPIPSTASPISLSWSHSLNVDSFQLFRRTAPYVNGYSNQIGLNLPGGNGGTFTDTTVVTGQTYEYSVRACKPVCSSPSNTQNVTVSTTTASSVLLTIKLASVSEALKSLSTILQQIQQFITK